METTGYKAALTGDALHQAFRIAYGTPGFYGDPTKGQCVALVVGFLEALESSLALEGSPCSQDVEHKIAHIRNTLLAAETAHH